MKRYLHFFLFLIILVSFSNCKKEAEVPLSEADFTSEYDSYPRFENFTFKNTSKNAVRCKWDFGNGTTSTESNPTISYQYTGKYTVKLTTYNEKNEASSASKSILIGNRYLIGVGVDTLDFSHVWDAQDGPDLQLALTISKTHSSQPYNYTLDMLNDVSPNLVPFGYNISNPVKFTDLEWTFQLNDRETDGSLTYMVSWEVNPVRVLLKRDPITGNQILKLTDKIASITIVMGIK